MNNLHRRFDAASVTPRQTNYNHLSMLHHFGNQELSDFINAANDMLRNRGCPPPASPRFSSPPPLQQPYIHTPPMPNPGATIPPPPPPRTAVTAPRSPAQPAAGGPSDALHGSLPPPSRSSDMWENAKVEQIICAGLKPLYDGTPDNLIPTLNSIQIRRRNEVWYPATFMVQDGKSIDLIRQFSALTEATVLNKAKDLWDSPDASTQSHTRGTTTYNHRLFGMFLMNSITPDFAALLHSRIDSRYCSDGPLLLYTMCQHIHRNHLAFVESIKTKVRSSTLATFHYDVPKYLRFLGDNMKLISSTGGEDTAHNDLIPHMLLQLRTTNIPLFQQSVLKWQRDYYEATLPLTPQTLIAKADQECQILQHAGQWVETIDPAVTALQATLQANTQKSGELLHTLVANLAKVNQQYKDLSRSSRPSTRQTHKGNYTPDWIYDSPAYPDQIRMHNGKYWHYCSKCGNNGRWVCTHTEATHEDSASSHVSYGSRRSPTHDNFDSNYHRSRSPARDSHRPQRRHSRSYDNRSRSRSPGIHSSSSSPYSPARHVTWQQQAPPTPVAKLSLLESLNMFMGDEE